MMRIFKGNETVYISGGITGVKDYHRYFKSAEEYVTSVWFEDEGICKVINPTCLNPRLEYEKLMDICRKFVEVSDVLVMIPGWKESKGAVIEHDLAEKLGKEIIYLSDDEFNVCLSSYDGRERARKFRKTVRFGRWLIPFIIFMMFLKFIEVDEKRDFRISRYDGYIESVR